MAKMKEKKRKHHTVNKEKLIKNDYADQKTFIRNHFDYLLLQIY